MSDYFSLPPRGTGGGTPAGTPGDDSNSERSSQYFMDLGNNASGDPTKFNLSPGTSDQIPPKDDAKSPYHVGVPVPSGMPVDTFAEVALGGAMEELEGKYVREFPTDVLVDRFKKWRKILKGIANYLREVAFAQEQFARINYQLKSSVKFPFLTDLEEGSNRIMDPFDPKVTPKRQQPLTVAQQREQQQLQQQQEILQNWQQQQQQQQQRNANGPQYQQPQLNTTHRDFNDDRAIGTDDIQVVKTDSESAAPSGFLKFGSGSIQDIQVVLKKYHLSIAVQQLKISKEINMNLLPRIEDLRRDLQSKIKEIKELSGDFRTNINEHVAITGQLLNRYISSVKYMTTNVADSDSIKLQKKGTQIKPKHDPYLLKLQLDLQLKRQLLEESYLREAYLNLQGSGMELEKIVYHKIQQILQRYSSLLDAEARLMIKNLCRELQQGILSKPTAFEWDKFVGHHPTCLINWRSSDPYPTSRKLSDVIYPQMKSPMAKCIRAGYLSKKSKFLKNYNKGYFVLTSNYLHEFKSSNFFNANQQEDSKESKSTSLSATQTAKASLVPVMSIALNDCVLTEASNDKFVLVGKPTYSDFEAPRLPRVATSSLQMLNHDLKHGLSHNPTSHFNEAPEKLTKQTKKTIGKLWKSAKPGGMGNGLEENVHTPKSEINEEKSSYQAMLNQENNKLVSWSFRPSSSNPSEEDVKQFRKWAHDLKNLTTFNTTKDRSKFIEERIIKANYRRGAQMLKHTSSSPSLMVAPDGSRSDVQSTKSNKPGHISLNNTGGMPTDWINRSGCNTPAVDDNGNLITVGEKRGIGSTMISSPLASPRYSVHSGSSPPSISGGASQQQLQSQFPAGMTITSKGISPNATVLNADPVAPPPLNRRSSSGLRSVTAATPPSAPSAGGSVASAQSEGSGGGYFAIPVKSNQEGGSQSSTPSFVDAPTGPPPQPAGAATTGSVIATQAPPSPYSLPRTGSYSAASRQYPSNVQAAQPTAVQQSLNMSSPIPKVRLNDQDLSHIPSIQSDFQMPPPAIQPPTLRRNMSSGDIPTVKSDMSGAAGNAFYQNRDNGSQTSLTAGGSRTHAIRKHKKNVSFSSLNSLVFSRKGANSGGNQNTEQFMRGGIREDDDDDDQTIKLHRSIYS
ncbi:ZYRO0C12606p [Zygosaccharomyces rouxii]|uniref:ZYRO0C12606p n=1 Tax=Zygosaccharomyces rouxii (strain ATCC 2623 / CBS 732 / NBRC 1130 / NCYC 568 / NRRL Y-229) TaxID=559307 RepID=C5DTZ8_ZYGRC|nr:uncharacterized protein ZYRO0C12606g [Zygosaccharomyces rouxii]KAH9201565.1 PH domain-containing protein [Zygosaccharomyces rouxii]CAR27259.1 ZYRO0C12606p [Zygosaccharomyces rouxii]